MSTLPSDSELKSTIIRCLKPIAKSLYNKDVLSVDNNQMKNLDNIMDMIASTATPLINSTTSAYAGASTALLVVEANILAIFGLSGVAGLVASLPLEKPLSVDIKSSVGSAANSKLQRTVLSIDRNQSNNIDVLNEIIAAAASGIVSTLISDLRDLMLAIAAMGSLTVRPIPRLTTAKELETAIVKSVTPIARKLLGGSVLSIDKKQHDNINRLVKLIAGMSVGITKSYTDALDDLARRARMVQSMMKSQMTMLSNL